MHVPDKAQIDLSEHFGSWTVSISIRGHSSEYFLRNK
jgi:hypothetical protein